MSDINQNKFQKDLLRWYELQKRDLPWRVDQNPYKVWVSEIMLQQTKVDTVIPYYNRFLTLFPTLEALAKAEEEKVMKAWEGLGYYSRARNLHSAVKEVQEKYGGNVPNEEEELAKLRGVGPYTKGAILSIAFNKPVPAVDGNVMRVMTRVTGDYSDIAKVTTRNTIDRLLRKLISIEDPSHFNQGLMELGALICTPKKPSCLLCPLNEHCVAYKEGLQSVLPVKAKKKKQRTIKMKAVVAYDSEDRVLIEQRPEDGLLAKLWQFPNLESLENDTNEIAKMLEQNGYSIEIGSKSQEIKHVFSHIIWEIEVYKAKVLKEVDQESNFIAVHLHELPLYTFSVSHQKIIEGTIMKGVEEWN